MEVFQTNCIFKIYRGPMQNKNMNIDVKTYKSLPYKKKM